MGLCLKRVKGIDPLVLWLNFHCFKRVDCQFTVVKEFDSNFKLCFDDNDQGAKKVIFKNYNLVFQRTVVNMYYPKTHFN